MTRLGNCCMIHPLREASMGFPSSFLIEGTSSNISTNTQSSLGIRFRFDSRISSYFEEDDDAGVIIGDEKIRADGIIASDGIHSYARRYITGIQQVAQSSGFAVYRSWFPTRSPGSQSVDQALCRFQERLDFDVDRKE